MEKKKWWTSKTLWANVIAVGASRFVDLGLSAEDQLAILGFINLVLRAITKEPLVW